MNSNIERLSDHLKTLGFRDHVTLAASICAEDHGGVIDNIINGFLSEEDLPKQKRFNLINLCFSKGIIVGMDVLKFLLQYKEQGSTFFGKGEALMRVLMRGIPTKSGDYEVSGKVFEVKYEKSRLRGMSGFESTDASGVASELDVLFADNPSLLNQRHKWNFVSDSRINTLFVFSEIVALYKMDPLAACKLFVQAWQKYFTKMTPEEATDLAICLSEEFDQDMCMYRYETGYSDFVYKMCAYAMKYYAKVERFDYMVVLNNEFDCICITKKFIEESDLDHLSHFIYHYFKITPPSLSQKAAIQGSAFGITLKSGDI
jgi:hypothetical protein